MFLRMLLALLPQWFSRDNDSGCRCVILKSVTTQFPSLPILLPQIYLKGQNTEQIKCKFQSCWCVSSGSAEIRRRKWISTPWAFGNGHVCSPVSSWRMSSGCLFQADREVGPTLQKWGAWLWGGKEIRNNYLANSSTLLQGIFQFRKWPYSKITKWQVSRPKIHIQSAVMDYLLHFLI